ncbi:MAG: anti-sigma factor [Pyrinomonadaceae bacterium]
MLDLLCKQAVYGLDVQEAKHLETIGHDEAESEAIDLTVASLGLIDLNTGAGMPAHLQARILADAEKYFGTATADEPVAAVPVREIVLNEALTAKPWFGWLGWAAAAAACVALAVSIFVPRNQGPLAAVPTPTPMREQILDPAQKRQSLLNSGQVLTAQIGKGNVKEIENVTGDIVWSDEKQDGYIRVKGLPKNDVSKETYQLWIFDENQDPKTPIDGGTFDINSDGEVIIPIDSKLKAKNPKMFAVTIEKAGGVVVSDRGKIAALAKRET